ncbi:hypothetical protein RISW2_02485, partial [Roseivivax isoporae LMG 25204]
MRRRLLVAALLGTTALVTPSRADAGPVAAFVGGVFAALGGGALAAGATAAATAGFAFASSALGGFIINTVISIGLAALANALRPAPQIPKPGARMVNYAQPVSYLETVYGEVRKGGPFGFSKMRGAYRHYTTVLAAHPCDGLVQHYLDEWPVEVDGSGDVTTSPPGDEAKVRFYDGGPGQVVDPDLDATFTEITSAHDYAGLCYGKLRAKATDPEQFSEDYPNGREWAYTPVFRGHNGIYDPRSDTTGYSNNAALVLAHWLTEILGREVDWDEVAVEADAADALVANAEGGTQPKWTINGTISDDQDFETQRAQMSAACDAFLFERTDGKVGFRVGRYIEPTVTLTPDDLFSVQVSQGETGSDAPTEIAPEYVDPDNHWREASAGTWVITTE